MKAKVVSTPTRGQQTKNESARRFDAEVAAIRAEWAEIRQHHRPMVFWHTEADTMERYIKRLEADKGPKSRGRGKDTHEWHKWVAIAYIRSMALGGCQKRVEDAIGVTWGVSPSIIKKYVRVHKKTAQRFLNACGDDPNVDTCIAQHAKLFRDAYMN